MKDISCGLEKEIQQNAILGKGGEHVSNEFISQITQTENKASEVRKQAHEETKRILTAAGLESRQIIQLSEKEAKKQADVVLKHTQAAAEAHVRKVKEQAKEEYCRLQENAEKKLEQAAEAMVERIVITYVGS